jgi:hypothetical protein
MLELEFVIVIVFDSWFTEFSEALDGGMAKTELILIFLLELILSSSLRLFDISFVASSTVFLMSLIEDKSLVGIVLIVFKELVLKIVPLLTAFTVLIVLMELTEALISPFIAGVIEFFGTESFGVFIVLVVGVVDNVVTDKLAIVVFVINADEV